MSSETVPRPVLLTLAILAGLNVVASASVVADLVGPTVTGVVLAVLAGVDVAVGVWLQRQVVPLKSTIAYERAGEYRQGGHPEARHLYLTHRDPG